MAMEFPDDLKYTKEHEWIRVEDNGMAVIGITDFAQDQLGDIVYVELPDEGTEIEAGNPFGVVESVKAVSDLNAPASGVVMEVNGPVMENPENLNEDVYEEGWLIKIKLKDKSELNNLLNHVEYQAFIEEEK